MPYVSQISLIGHAGADCEAKYLPSGTMVSSVNVAVNHKQKNSDVETTNWFRVTLWGKTAEFGATYIKKGALLFVTGDFNVRSYTNNNNVPSFALEVSASVVQLLTAKSDTLASSLPSEDEGDMVPF